MSVTIVALWRPRAEERETVTQGVLALAVESRREPGCLEYRVLRDTSSPGELLLIERYASPEAVEAHRASAHFQRIVLGDLVKRLERREVRILEELEVA